MDFLSPGSSAAQHDPHNLQSFPGGGRCIEPYDMGTLAPADLLSFQDSLTSNGFYNNPIDDQQFKMEPDWEAQSSTTPESVNTNHSDPLVTAPSARRRSTKTRRNTSTSTESSGAGQSSELSREKNRIAASKCRRKKKVEEHHLEERRRMLQVQHAILQDSAVQLKNEVLHLKNEILRHGACDYPPIQKYIETAASQLR